MSQRQFDDTIVSTKSQYIFINIHTGGREMSIQVKRIIIIGIIAIVAFVLGRLAVRALMNLLLGGTLFGGNIL